MGCPTCATGAASGARFCLHCGTALSPSPADTLGEERKVVTVVFVDLVGSTAMAERADVEHTRTVLSAYHACARTAFERFGGTVEKYIGDAVVAVFGAPTTHEDDAERAVRAACAVRTAVAALPYQLEVRIGINSGEALVVLDARPELGEAMVAPTPAFRPPPGTSWSARGTYRSTRARSPMPDAGDDDQARYR